MTFREISQKIQVKEKPKVYAKRRAGAITGISNGMWAKKLAGCNWLLEEVEKENPQRLLRVIK